MDTILYFYKKRELEGPVTNFQKMQGYLLVRTAVDVGENRWFSHVLILPEAPAKGREAGESRWKAFWRRKKQKKMYRRQRAQYRREAAQVRLEIRRFLWELTSGLDESAGVFCVYDDSVRKSLFGGKAGEAAREERADAPLQGLKELWGELWPFPEFNGYFQPEWAKVLLPYARLHHFVLLGTSPCAGFVLSRCARGMKSLRWFLPEGAYTEEMEEAAEAFYMDWGVAVDLQLLPGKRAYTRLLLETKEPVCVLDFSGEPRVPAAGLADGSVWLDFSSLEEKARAFCAGRRTAAYFSLKEVWKKACKP